MRILLTGGGTGGHTFPLIAVARKLKALRQVFGGELSRIDRGEEAEFLFVGPDSFSKSVFQKEGIPVRSILAGKFRRYFSPLNAIDLLKLPVGLLQAYWHLFWFMPDVIFAKGGYGSVAVVLMGWLFRIPIIIHESDIIPGLSNRILAKFARYILISFDYTASFFPKKKTAGVGNPIREELFLNIPQNPRQILKIASSKPIVFVLGGSQGAEEINNLILLALPDMVKKYEIIHQCGEANLETMKKGALLQLKIAEDRPLYHVYGSLSEEELSSAFSLASVVVSRAGAGAIFEIAASEKPSILIPYMSAAGLHQLKNAEIYEEGGACRIIRGANILPHIFINEIDAIVENPEIFKMMSQAALTFAKPDSARLIAEVILSIVL